MPYRALDLFCGAGGVSIGLQNAGFDVTGVDIAEQRNYQGGQFVHADAMSFPLTGYDLIWASPPCQLYTKAGHAERAKGKKYPDLIGPIRERLSVSGSLWVIENVPGAPLRKDVVLAGYMFPELKVVRERWFETNFSVNTSSMPKKPRGSLLRQGYVTVTGSGTPGYIYYTLGRQQTTDDCREAMGISWMSRKELSQAIPPQYSSYIGGYAQLHLLNRYLVQESVMAYQTQSYQNAEALMSCVVAI